MKESWFWLLLAHYTFFTKLNKVQIRFENLLGFTKNSIEVSSENKRVKLFIIGPPRIYQNLL